MIQALRLLLMKRKTASTLALGLLALLTACGDVTVGTRSMTDQLPVITIPGTALGSLLQLSIGASFTSQQLDLGSGEDFVTSVTVRNMDLNILDTSELDANEDGALDSFDFLTGLDISIRADFGGNTNQLLIATLPDGDPQFGSAARNLELTVVNSNTDVLDFLLAPGGYDIVMGFSGNIPSDDVIVSGEIRYRVGLGF